MKHLLIITLLLSKVLTASPVFDANCFTDTIPPPPGFPSPISGPAEACVGDTSVYASDIPVSCEANWYIDGALQNSTTGTLEVIWTESGSFAINLDFDCDTSIFPSDSLLVAVNDVPVVDLGNDTTIIEGQTLTLDAGNPGCTYLWSTGETTQTIIVSVSGNYEVVVGNTCGDASDDINVEVVVGVNDVVDPERLIVIVSGNKISVNIPNNNIEKVQIWDMSGRLILNSTNSPFHYLPGKGIYFIEVVTDDGSVFTKKLPCLKR